MLTTCRVAALPVARGHHCSHLGQGRCPAAVATPNCFSLRSNTTSAARKSQAVTRQQQWRRRCAGSSSGSSRHQQQQRASVRVSAMSGSGAQSGKTKVLFVCLGNICRSPSAEAVFKSVVEREGVAGQFEIDSCGTGGGSSNWYLPGGFSYHEGDPADSRMTATARTRGVTLTSRSRPLTPTDLAEFDYVVGMDAANIKAIRRAAEHWRANGGEGTVPADYASKLSLMTDFLQSQQYKQYNEVPDPYYGGQKGFELVLDLLDDACQGLLQTIQQHQPQKQ